MPHIIVEYPKQLAHSFSIDSVLQAIHNAIAKSGVSRAVLSKRAVVRCLMMVSVGVCCQGLSMRFRVLSRSK